jgi:outer membrane immunogenic protein
MDGADQRLFNDFQMSFLEKKMKKFLLATVALVALGATVPALAADLPARTYTKAPAYAPAPIYNWTGFYIGGHLGGAFNGNNGFSGAGLVTSNNNGAFLGGLQGGADYQFAPTWVVGIEAQYSWLGSSNNSTVFPGVGTFNMNQRGLGSVTGRLGYTWGPTLLYAKGGYAYSDNSQSLMLGGVGVPFTTNGNHHNGYTVGGGLEYMFAQNWSAKIEYQYYNFGKTSFVTPVALTAFGSTRNDEHTVKAGLNYHFNLGGPVARY